MASQIAGLGPYIVCACCVVECVCMGENVSWVVNRPSSWLLIAVDCDEPMRLHLWKWALLVVRAMNGCMSKVPKFESAFTGYKVPGQLLRCERHPEHGTARRWTYRNTCLNATSWSARLRYERGKRREKFHWEHVWIGTYTIEARDRKWNGRAYPGVTEVDTLMLSWGMLFIF